MLDSSIKIETPSYLIPWLTYSQSLTNKLKQCVGDAVDLKVLNQSWKISSWWTSYVLNVKESFLQREIVISALQKNCWYARTIIPCTTYQAHSFLVEQLKHKSLGEIIFNNEEISRQSLTYYPLDSQCMEYYWVKQLINDSTEIVWARKSSFRIKSNFSFYLIEIFLPDLKACL